MKGRLKCVGDNTWLLPVEGRAPITFIGNREIIETLEDEVFRQAINVAMTPGIQEVYINADAHEGYFSPVGGVAVSRRPDLVVAPGINGYDLHCGMRTIRTKIHLTEIKTVSGQLNESIMRQIVDGLDSEIPSGFNEHGRDLVKQEEILDVMKRGMHSRVIRERAHLSSDIENLEDSSFEVMEEGLEIITKRSQWLIGEVARAKRQIGTLGGGNHFISVDFVKVEDKRLSSLWGLYDGQIVVTIHSGSRHFGHQTTSYWFKTLAPYFKAHNLPKYDAEGFYIPEKTPFFLEYLGTHNAAANFAITNRHFMMCSVRRVFERVFDKSFEELGMTLLYDLSHNNSKFEGDGEDSYLIHRKGATRALPAGHPIIRKSVYFHTGHPVITPGNISSGTVIMVGLEGAKKTRWSVNHGCGRTMSRAAAEKRISVTRFEDTLGDVFTNAYDLREILDEAPDAYKDLDLIVDSMVGAGMTKVVARLIPLAVVKGSSRGRGRRKR